MHNLTKLVAIVLVLIASKSTAQTEIVDPAPFSKTHDQAITLNSDFQKMFHHYSGAQNRPFKPENTYEVVPSDKMIELMNGLTVEADEIKGLRIHYGLKVVDGNPKIVYIYSPVKLQKTGVITDNIRTYNVLGGYKYYLFVNGNFQETDVDTKDILWSAYQTTVRRKFSGVFQTISIIDNTDNNDTKAITFPWDVVKAQIATEARKLYDSINGADFDRSLNFVESKNKRDMLIKINSQNKSRKEILKDIISVFDLYIFSGAERLNPTFACCEIKHTIVHHPYVNAPAEGAGVAEKAPVNLGSLCPSHCGQVQYRVIVSQ